VLTKRTNILFDEELWQNIAILAKQEHISAGELVRRAVKKTYFSKNENRKIVKACEQIISLRKKFKKVNYKELINYGRKI
jgi:hypothetical protein